MSASPCLATLDSELVVLVLPVSVMIESGTALCRMGQLEDLSKTDVPAFQEKIVIIVVLCCVVESIH